MAGARATATILAGLPVLSVLMGQLIGARPMAFLLGGQLGGWLLVVGLTLVCGGLLWSDRITDRAVRAMISTAAMLLAAALLCGAGPSAVRRAAGDAGQPPRARAPKPPGPDPLAVASSLDVLAVCLAAGMAVLDRRGGDGPVGAAAAGADAAPRSRSAGAGRRPGRRVVAPAHDSVDPQIDALLRLARRSAASGAALADAVSPDSPHNAGRTPRTPPPRPLSAPGVLIAGPLGLCFLPAFVCLGIVPVVAGLAGDFIESGLL